MTSSASQVETMTSTSTWQAQDGLLLEVDELFVEFRTRYGVAKAINGVNSRFARAKPSPCWANPDPASP